ncbi:cytochrome c1 [Croceibacterium sp. LX-88]|jgi:ubiquinol-cytochrome c reductase cytochrome c1 subunit|uniref:Cytochrome c1 n=1 Tax=Croceibacterium selenioxidans TaxID=2838833 RepID=A0ABS5W652_9SPHN|nr:cytochrome c1 [Croceibacterium selenioxidans]MBT2135169.1 cytochrome c1 [Croceibacterium selenioxidans]
MIRLIGFFVGVAFTVAVLWAFATGAYTAATEPAAPTAEHEFHRTPRPLHLASDGPFGRWDLQQLQRGYQVYKEVCSACHSLKYVAFRDLAQLGYTEAEVKATAASWTVPGIDPVTGETNTRPGTPTDYFPSPFPNDIAARAANNNAIPPDLSLMTKARHDGAAYVHSLLTGYQDQPAELLKKFPDAKTGPGLHYNPYFANLNLAMAPPLSDDQVTYADGTKATVDQMATDVAAFLTWTAEPSLIKRKQTGWAVMIFLVFATILAWFAKKQVWAPITPKRPKKD